MAAPAPARSLVHPDVYPLVSLPAHEPVPAKTLSFARYSASSDALLGSAGADWGVHCVLELSQELALLLEQEFTVELIQRGLFALQPHVELHEATYPQAGLVRTDVPALSDDDVDALAEWCQQQLDPQRPSLLTQLLEEALS